MKAHSRELAAASAEASPAELPPPSPPAPLPSFTPPPPSDARLNLKFLRDLRALSQLAMCGPSGTCVLAELLLCGTVCLAVLCFFGVAHAPPLSTSDLLFLNVGAVCLVTMSNALPLLCSSSSPADHQPAGRRVRLFLTRHAIVFHFASVQAYNAAGFFASLVPAMIYATLTKQGEVTSGEEAPSCDAEFFRALSISAGYLGATVVSKSLMKAVERGAALSWRYALTEQIHQVLSAEAMYDVRLHFSALDNADQRVTREAELWATTLAEILTAVSQSAFALVWYSYQTWKITGWLGPFLIYGFFLFFAGLSRLVASPVASAVARVESCEGSFRHVHFEYSSRAELVSLSGGGEVQARVCQRSLGQLVRARGVLIARRLLLDLVLYANTYMGSAVNYLAIAVPICSGVYSNLSPSELVSVISQGSTFAISLVYGCTKTVETATKFSQLAGYTHRIAALTGAVESVKKSRGTAAAAEWRDGRRRSPPPSPPPPAPPSPLLECHDLEVRVPSSGRVLLHSVSFSVGPSSSLLLTGPSGCGKSSLLRVLHGLWPISRGWVASIPSIGSAGSEGGGVEGWGEHKRGFSMFLAQAPHLLLLASLREQLAFPLSPGGEEPSDTAAIAALALVDLDGLVHRLGGLDHATDRWSYLLSPGQQQLLCLARLFIHRPALALLDEATSAISVESESRVYHALTQRGIAIVSVGHRPSLIDLHDVHLPLKPHLPPCAPPSWSRSSIPYVLDLTELSDLGTQGEQTSNDTIHLLGQAGRR